MILRPNRIRNLAGQSFGRLTAISYIDGTKPTKWLCKCLCGAATVAVGTNLTRGNTFSCGCQRRENRHKRLIDLRNQTFGRLTALYPIRRIDMKGNTKWWCRCSCGNEKAIDIYCLREGFTISCGCAVGKVVHAPERPEKARKISGAQSSRRRARKNGGSHTKAQIDQMYLDQDGLCACCWTHIKYGTYHKDHKTPVSKGGSDDISNIQLLCIPCNRQKYNRNDIEFLFHQVFKTGVTLEDLVRAMEQGHG